MIVSIHPAADDKARASGNLNDPDFSEQQRLYCQSLLAEMAKVKIVLNERGLTLIAPNRDQWEPDDMVSREFSQMPESFARSYLQLRLKSFLYETFCLSEQCVELAMNAANENFTNGSNPIPKLTNERIGGGLHLGLLEQFSLYNKGNGYFDPGWQLLGEESDGTLAVEKYGVIVHVNRLNHLKPEQQTINFTNNFTNNLSVDAQADRLENQTDAAISIRLPSYQFEPGVYVAIGDCGPVSELVQATEIYFSAEIAALPVIMETLTTALNGEDAIPNTLQVPYGPEGYQGPEAVVLQIEKTALGQVMPLLHKIRETCAQSDVTTPMLRTDWPVFAQSLYPDAGISVADVVKGGVTRWSDSSADLSRSHLVAEALVQTKLV